MNEKLKALIEAAKKCQGFMECFEKGQKRMTHDLSLSDTVNAVTASIALRKALTAFESQSEEKSAVCDCGLGHPMHVGKHLAGCPSEKPVDRKAEIDAACLKRFHEMGVISQAVGKTKQFKALQGAWIEGAEWADANPITGKYWRDLAKRYEGELIKQNIADRSARPTPKSKTDDEEMENEVERLKRDEEIDASQACYFRLGWKAARKGGPG